MMRIVTIGGSVTGLACAMALADAGHDVLVLDGAPEPPTDPTEATTAWDRPSVPQARHSHAFASAGTAVIRDHFPTADAALKEAGAYTVGLASPPPPGLTPFHGDPSDAELEMVVSRRNLLEWALHRAASTHQRVELRYGCKVSDLVLDEHGTVTGVRLEDDRRVAADLVVDASGRRSRVAQWLAQAGIDAREEESSSAGISYYTRHYRRTGDRAGGPLNRGFGAGGVWDSYTAVLFLGDADTFTISVGVSPREKAFKALRDPQAFEALLTATPLLAGWLDPAVSQPISDMEIMGGLANSWTPLQLTSGAAPVGIVRVGDSFCTTNPAYGRGVSLALTHALRLARQLADRDQVDQELCDALLQDALAHYRPWYEEAVANDAARNGMWAAAAAGAPPGPAAGAAGGRQGPPSGPPALNFGMIAAAAATDETVWRRLARTMMMLDRPEPLYTDPQIRERVMTALAAAGGPPPQTGCDRATALAVVQRDTEVELGEIA